MLEQHSTLTIEQARAFADQAPWREVQWQKPDSQMDPHWYLIVGNTIDPTTYWAMVRLIRAEGYLGTYTAPYRPDKPMKNHYLEIGEYVYWVIPPRQLCRTRIEFGQHERVSTPGERSEGGGYDASKRVQITTLDGKNPADKIHEDAGDGTALCGTALRDYNGQTTMFTSLGPGPVTCLRCSRTRSS